MPQRRPQSSAAGGEVVHHGLPRGVGSEVIFLRLAPAVRHAFARRTAGAKRIQFGGPLMRLTILASLLFITTPLAAQDRVKPKAAKGGQEFGEPWAKVPAEDKKL